MANRTPGHHSPFVWAQATIVFTFLPSHPFLLPLTKSFLTANLRFSLRVAFRTTPMDHRCFRRRRTHADAVSPDSDRSTARLRHRRGPAPGRFGWTLHKGSFIARSTPVARLRYPSGGAGGSRFAPPESVRRDRSRWGGPPQLVV